MDNTVIWLLSCGVSGKNQPAIEWLCWATLTPTLLEYTQQRWCMTVKDERTLYEDQGDSVRSPNLKLIGHHD